MSPGPYLGPKDPKPAQPEQHINPRPLGDSTGCIWPGALTDEHDILREARRVLSCEARAIGQIILNEQDFVKAVFLLASARRMVFTTGVGKAGLVAQRVAATLTVTGTPATYLHPADALHGDLGRLVAGSVLVAVSRSGETNEVLDVVHYAGERDIEVLAITAGATSGLASLADVVLLHPGAEACRHGLTPTSTIAASGALGDALALCVQRVLGFGAVEFAALHREGNLGRRLSVTVGDVMVKGGLIGRVYTTNSVFVATIMLARLRGTIIVETLTAQRFVGVVTAGDLVRYLDRTGHSGIHNDRVGSIMSTRAEAQTTEAKCLLTSAIDKMQRRGIMALPVLEGDVVVGVLHLHDALRARVA